jgi:hypothetical protein
VGSELLETSVVDVEESVVDDESGRLVVVLTSVLLAEEDSVVEVEEGSSVLEEVIPISAVSSKTETRLSPPQNSVPSSAQGI